MDEIRKMDRATDLAIFKPGMSRAIDVRSQLLNVPEVIQALNQIERQVLEASIKTPIADISDEELTRKIAALGKYIARDAGIKNLDDYSLTRFVTVLKSYYPLFSLQEIRIAFELSMSGELDEFLPRDKYGNPDKNHYQTFNIEYITKILNAYKKCRRETEHKAYTALPEPKGEMTPQQIRQFEIQRQWRNRYIFLRYKYTGKLILELTDDMFLYEWLQKCGLADDVQVKEDDRKEAFALYMQRVARGMINQYTAFQVRRKGTESPEIDFTAFEVARKKEIIKAFDRMIAEGMQVDNYLKFV